VRLAFTEEHESLRAMVRDFLSDRSPESEVRRLMDTDDGFDPDVWHRLGSDLGLCGLTVPEKYGGAGANFVELGVVLEELGAYLACLPFFSSVVLAQGLIAAMDDPESCARWLPGLASGELRGTVAFAEDGGGWDGRDIRTRAAFDAGAWHLDGAKTYVVDGATAQLTLVLAETDAGPSVFGVEAGAPGLTRSPLATMDQTRKQARIGLSRTPALLVGAQGDGARGLARMSELAAVALAVEAVGGTRAALDQAVEYAKVRVQFGRPIGSFQAIKHRCADMLLRLETARSAAYHGMWAATEDDADELSLAASMAKAHCTEAFAWVAAENIQVHGGIGFTWEHPAHLYYKRAVSSELLFGDPAHHRALLADKIGV